MQLHLVQIKQFLDYSLSEDLGIGGDITSKALIDKNKNIEFSIIARERIIFCGHYIADYYFNNYSNVKYQIFVEEGKHINSGAVIMTGIGNALEILALERTILNYLQHLSSIATLTNLYVSKINNNKTKICDTRKTLPGLRTLQKYAVVTGGGTNHRLALDSSILIKDNHIAICGNIKEALQKAKKLAPHYTKIEIECDNIDQVKEAVSCNADIIMLDNMTLEQIKEAVKIINFKALIEVSGGVNLENVASIAELGVDLISIGRLTNSAPVVDIGLDIVN